jgi:Helix-hairpin-helix motif
MRFAPSNRIHAALAALAAVSSGAVCAASPPDPLAGEQASLQAVCAKCHNLQIVMDTPMSYEGWHDTVQKMIDRGADGTDDQLADIMDYLHRTMTTIEVNSADADELAIVLGAPEPVAQAIVARRKAKKFKNLDDLKSVPGIDAASVDAKSRLLFFQ